MLYTQATSSRRADARLDSAHARDLASTLANRGRKYDTVRPRGYDKFE